MRGRNEDQRLWAPDVALESGAVFAIETEWKAISARIPAMISRRRGTSWNLRMRVRAKRSAAADYSRRRTCLQEEDDASLPASIARSRVPSVVAIAPRCSPMEAGE